MIDESANHALVCSSNNGLRTIRHDKVCEALSRALKRNPTGARVEKGGEHARHAGGPRGTQRVAITDLEYVGLEGRVLIDVTVVEPSSKTSRELHNSVTKAGGAAEGAARRKRRDKYSSVPDLEQNDGTRLVCFALESTGRLGEEALKFIEGIFPPGQRAHGAFNNLLTEISVIMSHSSALMVRESWGRVGV